MIAAMLGLSTLFCVGFFVVKSTKLAFEYVLTGIITVALAFEAGMMIKIILGG